MYHPFRTMPSVNDELAALRAQGAVRTHAQTLSAKSPRNLTLSTPEAEEAALKAKREADKLKKKEAEERLRKNQAGMGDASVKHSLEWKGKKKEDMERAKQAREILVKGTATAGGGKGAAAAVGAGGKEGSGEKANATAEIEEPEEIKVSDVAAKFNSKTPAPVAPAPSKPVEAAAASAAKKVEKVRESEAISVEPAPAPEATSAEHPLAEPTMASNNQVEQAKVDDDVPELEEPLQQPTTISSQKFNAVEEPQAATDEAADDDDDNDNLAKITNRAEKKARKFLSRLDLRPVPGVTRVTLKTGGGRGYFVIDRPDVFCSTEDGSGGKGQRQQHASYVIFGEAKHGGGGFSAPSGADAAKAQAQAQAVLAQRQAALAAAQKGNSHVMESLAEEEEGEEVEIPDIGGDGEAEAGVEAKDVELVMSQASCSRAEAVKALRANDNDLVNAIMSLTT